MFTQEPLRLAMLIDCVPWQAWQENTQIYSRAKAAQGGEAHCCCCCWRLEHCCCCLQCNRKRQSVCSQSTECHFNAQLVHVLITIWQAKASDWSSLLPCYNTSVPHILSEATGGNSATLANLSL